MLKQVCRTWPHTSEPRHGIIASCATLHFPTNMCNMHVCHNK